MAASSNDKMHLSDELNAMEMTMSEQSSMHSYLNWSKERIDEMDAILASLEAKAGQVQVDFESEG